MSLINLSRIYNAIATKAALAGAAFTGPVSVTASTATSPAPTITPTSVANGETFLSVANGTTHYIDIGMNGDFALSTQTPATRHFGFRNQCS